MLKQKKKTSPWWGMHGGKDSFNSPEIFLSRADMAFHWYVAHSRSWMGSVNKAHSPHNWAKNKTAHGKSVFKRVTHAVAFAGP